MEFKELKYSNLLNLIWNLLFNNYLRSILNIPLKRGFGVLGFWGYGLGLVLALWLGVKD